MVLFLDNRRISCDSHANDADVIGEQSRSVYKRRSQGQKGEVKGIFLPRPKEKILSLAAMASVVNIPAGTGGRPTMIQSFQAIHHTGKIFAPITARVCDLTLLPTSMPSHPITWRCYTSAKHFVHSFRISGPAPIRNRGFIIGVRKL
jgi:hypothetical protein